MKTVDNYWILLRCNEDDSAVIDYFPEDCPEDWELRESEPMAHEFDGPIYLEFSDRHPKKVKLYDFTNNMMSLLIVSSKVKAVFDSLDIGKLEYIPAHIHDHQESLVSNDYFVINTLNDQPIIDMNSSKCVMDPLDLDDIDHINELHLNLDEVDLSAKLFRATNENSYYFITDEVLKALQDAGITGIRAIKAEGWDGNILSFI